jgi:hypothetical protein
VALCIATKEVAAAWFAVQGASDMLLHRLAMVVSAS